MSISGLGIPVVMGRIEEVKGLESEGDRLWDQGRRRLLGGRLYWQNVDDLVLIVLGIVSLTCFDLIGGALGVGFW